MRVHSLNFKINLILSIFSFTCPLRLKKYIKTSKNRYFSVPEELTLGNSLLKREKKKLRTYNSFRRSHQICSKEKSVLKIFAKFTGKHLSQGLFFCLAVTKSSHILTLQVCLRMCGFLVDTRR